MPVTVTQRRQAIEIAISEMTFGIEIECYIPQSVALTVGSYFNGAQVPGLPAGWVAKTDGSLIQNFPGTKGVEFVSPVLKGADGLRQVFQVCRQLRACGCRINGSCGFHVHIGWTLPTDTAAGMAKICNLVWTVANLEGAIYAATGTKARERGTYSRSVKANYRVLEMDKAETLRAVPFDRIESMNLALSPRYHVLNLQTLLSRPGYGYKPTVEFRPFSATLNPHKMTAFIRLCLAIVGKAQAMKRRGNRFRCVAPGVPDPGLDEREHAFQGRRFEQMLRGTGRGRAPDDGGVHSGIEAAGGQIRYRPVGAIGGPGTHMGPGPRRLEINRNRKRSVPGRGRKDRRKCVPFLDSSHERTSGSTWTPSGPWSAGTCRGGPTRSGSPGSTVRGGYATTNSRGT
jgi:hypothetical protein